MICFVFHVFLNTQIPSVGNTLFRPDAEPARIADAPAAFLVRELSHVAHEVCRAKERVARAVVARLVARRIAAEAEELEAERAWKQAREAHKEAARLFR